MLQKKSALGRGLGALIDVGGEKKYNSPSNDLPLDVIEVNPFQPRRNFDEEALLELAASIREYGVIQPITVRELSDGRYQIISGERRFRASRLAGLEKIPAFVRHAEDGVLLEMALVENIQREDLDAIEVALSYQRLIEECNYTQDVLSEKVGKKRSSISNLLRLLKLPAEIQLALRGRKISMGHAKALLNLSSVEAQIKTCLKVIESDFSVRQTEEWVKKLQSAAVEKPALPAMGPARRKALKALSAQLNQVLVSEVRLQQSATGEGKIIIPFQSDSDLERIISLLNQVKA